MPSRFPYSGRSSFPLCKGIGNNKVTVGTDETFNEKIVGDWILRAVQVNVDTDQATLTSIWIETDMGAPTYGSSSAIGLAYGHCRTNSPLYWDGNLPLRGVNQLRVSATNPSVGSAFRVFYYLEEMR